MGTGRTLYYRCSSWYTGRSRTWLSTLMCLQRRASVVLTWYSVSVSPPSPSTTCRIYTLPMRSSFRTSPGSSQWFGSTTRGSGQLTKWQRWLSGELLHFYFRWTFFAQNSILSWLPNVSIQLARQGYNPGITQANYYDITVRWYGWKDSVDG